MRTLIVYLMAITLVNVCHTQWVQTNSPAGVVVTSFASIGTNLYAGSTRGVYLTTDNGTLWTRVNGNLTDTTAYRIIAVGTTLFIGTPSGVFLSANGGQTWSLSLSVSIVNALVASGTAVFTGTFGRGVFMSTNTGTSWTSINAGLTDSSVTSLAVNAGHLFAGTQSGVFRSTNSGNVWTWVGLTNVSLLAAGGSRLFAGLLGGAGVSRSTNDGASWTTVNSGLTDLNVLAFAVHEGSFFAGTAFAGVFLFGNATMDWIAVDSGLTATYIAGLGVSGADLFAGTLTGGVWRRPLSEMITDVGGDEEFPGGFVLFQNYPNPFNPGTAIGYRIPSRSHVTVTIYNTLSQQVAQLVNEQQQGGFHEAVFHGDGLASGVYFYRLQAGDFVQTKKLVLMK